MGKNSAIINQTRQKRLKNLRTILKFFLHSEIGTSSTQFEKRIIKKFSRKQHDVNNDCNNFATFLQILEHCDLQVLDYN